MQITKVTLAGIALVCGLSSASYGVQLLTNRGFQTVPDHSVGWTFSNTNVEVKEYPNSFWSPGPVPSGNGSWGLEAVSNGGSKQGLVSQSVAVAPGTYEISASAWANVFDNTIPGDLLPSRVRFRLFADGVVQETIVLEGPSSTGSGWTGWTKLQTQTYIVPVVGSLAVDMQLRADGTNGWGQVAADDFRLDATLIPEPAGLLLLGLGSVVLLPRRMRRN